MAEITVKIPEGLSYPLLHWHEKARESLRNDGVLVLSGNLTPELEQFFFPSVLLRLSGDPGKHWRVDIEGGQSRNAQGGDIVVCMPERSFEVCSLGSISEPTNVIRRVMKPPRTYFCPIEGCISAFNRKDNLRRHIRDQHKEYSPDQLDMHLVNNVTSIAVERIAAAFPAVALQPEVRGFDDVENIEDRLRMFSRSIQSIMRREFPNFNLWAELRIGGNAVNSEAEMS
ncbi:hypothetical protein BZA77DRAFT_82947 [Pyronema omphalodes]|nr:hypothetical protein BZA77DRAFT_82947 [Pyronema omphalodes]